MITKTVLVILALLMLVAPVAQAAPPGPEIDQEQPIWQAGLLFGQWSGQWNGTTALAQTFTANANKKLCQVTVNLFDTYNDPGVGPDAFMELWSDNGNGPGELLASASNSISANTTTSYLADATFVFDGPRLHRNTQYWLVLRTNPDNVTAPFAAGYQYGASDPYAGGELWRLTNGAWVLHGRGYSDLYFREHVCNR